MKILNLLVITSTTVKAFIKSDFCQIQKRSYNDHQYSQRSRNRRVVVVSAASNNNINTEEEEDAINTNNPLSNGIDSVNWLPSLTETAALNKVEEESTTEKKKGVEVLPFFPLGGIVYTPHSTHTLNIFEPRYRKMYNDILFNGSKRFVVAMSHPEKKGVFAETGVIFYLDDLKEVSEMTADQIKYICSHRVTNRVKLHRILNPQDWETRQDYLKVEATILDDEMNLEDSDDDDKHHLEALPEENSLKQTYADLVDLQHDLEEDVRFTKASVKTLSVEPGGGETSLWATVRLWQSYIEQRLVARQNEIQKDFQEKLVEFLKKEKNLDENQLPRAIGFTDLSPQLQKEVTDLQLRMTRELEPLVLESTLTMQKILETDQHKNRVNLVKYFMDAERKRLEARKFLQNMFPTLDDNGDTVTTTVEDKVMVDLMTGEVVDESDDDDQLDELNLSPEEISEIEEEEENDDDSDDDSDDDMSSSSSSSSGIFFDDTDAFQ